MARQSISSVFADRAQRAPHEIIVVDAHRGVTALEIDRRANRLARALAELGTRRDDLVAVSLPNRVEFVVACLAVWRAGATPIPMDPVMSDIENSHLESLARPRVRIGAHRPGSRVPALDEGQAVAQPDTALPDQWARAWKAPATSGSTGSPKIVVANAPALVDPEAPIAPFVPRRATQLITSPLWHSTAFTYAFRGLTAGHRVILCEQFDEVSFLDAVERHRVTWTVLSPPSVRRLIRMPVDLRAEFDVSSLDLLLHLGGRCPVPDKLGLIDWLGADRVVEVYAGSESNGLTMASGREWLQRPGTVGRPAGGTELSIRADDGTEVPVGQTGTVWMRRGDTATYHYLGARSRRTADGWDTLDDLGYVDHDGYLFILDRAADAIRAGGSAVYPADVEQLVERLPQVRGAVVYADHADLAEPAFSVVADIGDHLLDAAALADHVSAHLGQRWRPRHVTFTRTPLRNDAGKIQRRSLASRGAVAPPTPTRLEYR